MAFHLSEKEKQKIIRLLKNGKSQNWIAKAVGRAPNTIGRIARDEGIESHIQAPKKANEARRHFAREDRMALITQALERGGELLEEELTAQQYQQVMTGIAIGIDKHRLETGEATSRSESRYERKDFSAFTDKELAELERDLRSS